MIPDAMVWATVVAIIAPAKFSTAAMAMACSGVRTRVDTTVAMAFAAYTISEMSISVYGSSEFWLNSPGLIFIKLGAVLMLIAFSYVWNLQMSAQQWSWVRQFGMTSLLVYWIHVELVYGRWFSWLKESLNVGETAIAAVIVIAAMLGLSLLRTNWGAVRAWTGGLGQASERVSGD